MIRSFASPQLYLQGAKAFETQLAVLQPLGKRALLVTDAFVLSMLGEKLQIKLQEENISCEVLLVEESSEAAIQRGRQLMEQLDFVIALGGGKAIDVGKGIAFSLVKPIAVLPTSAASDAATSRIAVLYSSEGIFEGYQFYPKNPEIVLVDTEVILKAPPGMLKAGFADGLATFIEARSIWQDGSDHLTGAKPTLAAYALAEKCYETLLQNIQPALAAQAKQQVDQSFEDVVEANLLLSGLGFENGGLSLAHAFHNVIATLEGSVQKYSHGEKVAVGILLQLLVENRQREFAFIQALFTELELPTSLTAIGLIDFSLNELADLAAKIWETKARGNHLPSSATQETIQQALLQIK